jgi:hypothetical protein
MDLDVLEPVVEFLMEFAPQFLVEVFRPTEPIPPEMSSKNGIQTLFGADEWWDRR